MAKYKKNGSNVCGDYTIESDSLLHILRKGRVFRIWYVADRPGEFCKEMVDEHANEFCIREKCDDYYSVFLTREEVVVLGHELIALASSEPQVKI